MKEPPHMDLSMSEEEIANFLRLLDKFVKAFEEACGYITRAQTLAKEAQQRGNPH